MTSQEMGIDYFSIATDIKDDDKVFALKYHYAHADSGEYNHAAAWAAYGRFIDLLAAIYHEGFAIEVTKQKQLRLSQQLGMTVDEFNEFVQVCVDCGLFDAGIFKDHQALTSRGIQKRYFHAVKRRKGNIPAELQKYIITGEETQGQTVASSDADMMQTSCEHDANIVQQDVVYKEKKRKEDKRKVNKTKEDERKGAPQSANVENSVENTPDQIPSVDSLISNLSNHFSSSPDTRQHLQPYPLSCFSLVGSDSKFLDLMEQPHETAWDALCASFKQRTGTGDVDSFVKAIAKKCPCKCSESPEQVSQCFGLMMKALKKFDRTKCHSPTPLVLKVLEDRTVDDG